MITDHTGPIDPSGFHDLIYGGDVVCFRQLGPMVELVEAFRRLSEEATAPHEPTGLHRMVDHDEAIVRLDRYQKQSLNDPAVSSLWRAVLVEVGLDPASVAVDRLLARVQTPRSAASGVDLVTAPLGVHRDTWASNMYAQVNWWAPIYDIDEGRTMEIYPDLFTEPLPNTSAEFDIVALREQSADSTTVVPRLSIDSFDAKALSVVIRPGDLLAFSGAHLHRSVPNTTDETRYSLDTRTIWIADAVSGRGAPNVDGRARWRNPGWFRRLDDGTPLHELLGVAATTAA